jgi:hypothetical protein
MGKKTVMRKIGNVLFELSVQMHKNSYFIPFEPFDIIYILLYALNWRLCMPESPGIWNFPIVRSTAELENTIFRKPDLRLALSRGHNRVV